MSTSRLTSTSSMCRGRTHGEPYRADNPIDYTTMNLLGECDTEWEAEGFVNRITPHGRYGPMGHDIRIEKREIEHD